MLLMVWDSMSDYSDKWLMILIHVYECFVRYRNYYCFSFGSEIHTLLIVREDIHVGPP